MSDLREKRKKRQISPRGVGLVVALVLLAFILGFVLGMNMNDSEADEVPQVPEQSEEIKETTQQENKVEAAQKPTMPEISEELLIITTPYGDLGYSVTWKDSITIEENTESGYVLTFNGKVGEREERLFTVAVGEEIEESHLFGTIDGENLYISVASPETDEWSEEEISDYTIMQEEVNNVIGQIYELSGFEAL